MRCVWCLLALAGCNFAHGLFVAPSADSSVDPDVASDAPPPDAVIDARIAPYCDPLDPNLVACYQFEGNTLDSSPHHLDATMTNVTFPTTGKVGKAMLFATNSAADVANSALWDVSAITIEAWIKPSQLPATGARMGILDMEGQYGFFVHENGRLQCTMINGVSAQLDANITTTAWTHVACTYDGSTTTIYVNGAVLFTGSGGGTLATGGNSGISIAADNPPGSGSRLIGLIDEVRMMSRARTAKEICLDAGACTGP